MQTKKSCNVEAIVKTMMMQVVMEAAINSSMQHGNNH
ncbi:hypothetical protein Gotur_010391, partial [Gossypium turneri]